MLQIQCTYRPSSVPVRNKYYLICFSIEYIEYINPDSLHVGYTSAYFS